MIVGVGIDVVDVDRFVRQARDAAGLLDRLFAGEEFRRPDGTLLAWPALASRFAVKEAALKALGVPRGFDWHDLRVSQTDRVVTLEVTGRAGRAASALGVDAWGCDVTGGPGVAIAVVLAQRVG